MLLLDFEIQKTRLLTTSVGRSKGMGKSLLHGLALQQIYSQGTNIELLTCSYFEKSLIFVRRK